MITARTRQIGNSIMIEIPKELHPIKDQEYLFYKTDSGAIIMVPRIKNPFKSKAEFQPAADNVCFEKQSIKDWLNK